MLKCLFTNGSEDTTLKVISNIDGKYKEVRISVSYVSHIICGALA